jgi:hypothetical protein
MALARSMIPRLKNAIRLASFWGIASAALLAACGGGGGTTPPPPTTYTATSGVAQKGPLIQGSTVTAQELTAGLVPTGKQYSYQTNSDLGTFMPGSTFTSQYIGTDATGYYFDEVQNAISGGTITLNGYSDLGAATVLNVNLLTTLAYQRIQHLVTTSGKTFTNAQIQAENEVLAALEIQDGASYGPFSALDISKGTDGDKMLAAISSVFVYGNSSGNLSALIASFQSDLGANGVITSAATKATLAASAKSLSAATVAANLSAKYASAGVTFTATDISDWIDSDGDGVIGKFKFQVSDATPSSSFVLPSFVVNQIAGTSVSVSGGTLSVNGVAVSGAVVIQSTDTVAVAPPAGAFPNGVQLSYLLSGATRVARVAFMSGLASIAVTPASSNLPVGASYHYVATGTFTDTSTADITATAQWQSSMPGIATINASGGTARALATGQTMISATSGSISGTAILTVVPAALQSVAVTPNPFSTGVAIARAMRATGTYTDASTSDLTATALWTTLDPTVASVSGGIVTGVTLGATTVTASSAGISGSAALAVTANVWSAGGNLTVARNGLVAVILPGGQVLAIGGTPVGQNSSTGATESYDPTTNAWTYEHFMMYGRIGHTATVLPNGKVLVVGGGGDAGPPIQVAEIYDPTANAWSTAGATVCARSGHTTTVLQTGKVLVAGGVFQMAGVAPMCPGVLAIEIYDPSTGAWSTAASMLAARNQHTATLLRDGKLLLAGGTGSADPSAEVYDPVANAWTATGSMSVHRTGHTASLLSDGRVLAAGGWMSANGSTGLASAETFDETSNTWVSVASMSQGRVFHTATVLLSGSVLIAGGASANGGSVLASSEVFSPTTGQWTPAAMMLHPYVSHAAVLLQNGIALVVGNGGATGLYW